MIYDFQSPASHVICTFLRVALQLLFYFSHPHRRLPPTLHPVAQDLQLYTLDARARTIKQGLVLLRRKK
jgi:hypothetical protein